VRIVVPVKQVPATDAVRMDPETGTMVRSGTEAVINPLDLYAVEAALQMRERLVAASAAASAATPAGPGPSGDGAPRQNASTAASGEGDDAGEGDAASAVVEIIAITMGPPPAEAVLREAISLGCDRGVLLSDRRFGGADTWATSRVLAAAIERLAPVNLVIAGERATDGDTAQVGPGIAAWLDLPLATYVAAVDEVGPAVGFSAAGDRATGDGGAPPTHLTVERLVEEGYQIVRIPLPALITVVKEIAPPRLPTLEGKMRARRAEITVLGADDLDVPAEELGLAGSPTRVVRIATPQVTRSGETVDARDDATVFAAAVRIVDFLEAQGVV
jgi:electron transfer flavoprotein beta subunit